MVSHGVAWQGRLTQETVKAQSLFYISFSSSNIEDKGHFYRDGSRGKGHIGNRAGEVIAENARLIHIRVCYVPERFSFLFHKGLLMCQLIFS